MVRSGRQDDRLLVCGEIYVWYRACKELSFPRDVVQSSVGSLRVR